MITVDTLALFTIFGAVCASYVSVIGFTLTAVGILALLGAGTALGLLPFGVWLLAGAFVFMQVGYVVGMVGTVLVQHVRRLTVQDPRRIDGERRINQE